LLKLISIEVWARSPNLHPSSEIAAGMSIPNLNECVRDNAYHQLTTGAYRMSSANSNVRNFHLAKVPIADVFVKGIAVPLAGAEMHETLMIFFYGQSTSIGRKNTPSYPYTSPYECPSTNPRYISAAAAAVS
jgi:hypothetical protein